MENRVYADAFGLFASLTDIKINFGMTQPKIDESGMVAGEERIFSNQIILSLPIAKELAKKLSSAVADYEDKFGVILDLDELRKAAVQETE